MANIFSSNRVSNTKRENPVSMPVIAFAEVAQVLLDSDDPAFNPPGNVNVGSIKARLLATERGRPVESLTWYSPLSMNDLQIPLLGEVVMLVLAPSRNIVKSKKSSLYYYTSLVSMVGNVTNNAIKGFSKPITQSDLTSYTGNQNNSSEDSLGTYIPETAISNLVAFEGDKIIQGRWGHAIRFTNTSEGANQSTFWNKDGTNGDPLVVISNGHKSEFPQPYLEAINDDDSTIVLSSAQSIDLITSNGIHQSLQAINQFSSGQIVLNSDRLVLNSKSDGVIISGANGVYITTPDWKTDFNELMDLLEIVVTELNDFMSGSKPASTGAGPTGPTPGASALASALQKLKELKQ